MDAHDVERDTYPSGCARIIRALFVLVFLSGALASGYFFYSTVHDWFETPFSPLLADVSSNQPNPPPSSGDKSSSAIDQADERATAPPNSAPAASDIPPTSAGALIQEQPKPNWDRQERINFLLLGLDLRPGERGAANTDTMMIVSVDPATKSVTMLSIPRDLWVPIPGYGENRINTAYAIGILRNYPGGGPALAKKTVQYNFGIPIHYYVTINFVGFRKLVDALGGITIDVPRDIYDPTFPDDRYGYRPLTIRRGRQSMNGDMALAYARTRHVDNDFGRMFRQQQVLKAIKDKALSLDVITKIPALWAAKEDMAQTDLKLNEILALAQLAKDVKAENIHSAVLDDSMTTDWTTPNGAMVLLPKRDRIRQLIAQQFNTSAPVVAQPEDQLKRLASEGAKIEIANGTTTEGLAGRVSEWLKGQGFNVVLVDSAERSDYAQTMLFESGERPYTRGLLTNIFHLSGDRVRKAGGAQNQVDIRVVIGRDFDPAALPNSQ